MVSVVCVFNNCFVIIQISWSMKGFEDKGVGFVNCAGV